jgi:regulator of RNase E activity RraB
MSNVGRHMHPEAMLLRLAATIFSTLALAVSTAVAQPAALEQDARVIEVLLKNGSDFTKPHRVDYFFVMPTEASAKAIAAELQSTGFVVQRIGVPPRLSTWEVHVQRSQLVQLEAMQATTIAFTKLAERFGGVYDGWGAPVAK